MALDPAHVAATTSAIATVIFSKALEKSGEHMGDAVYQRARQLIKAIRDKFEQRGFIETLTEAQEDPTERNIGQFTQELANLMSEDETFAAQVEQSLLSFSEDAELQKILAKTDFDKKDWSSQPLSVEQFKDTVAKATSEPRTPLKVQPDPPENET